MKEYLNGIAWGEGLRWHNGKLYFSDIFGKKVYCSGGEGQKEIVADMEDMPSGLGFLPDGSMLIVSGGEKKVLRLDGDDISMHADLSALCVGINDMVVDSRGNAYVGAYGFEMQNYNGGEANGWVYHISPDGTVTKVCEGLAAPNGMVITPDGRLLIVADTFQKKLFAYEIREDGIPQEKTVWAELSSGPDGICLDETNAVWAAFPNESKVARIEKGGNMTDEISFADTPLCCALGGVDRKTLFVVTVPAHKNLSSKDLNNFDVHRENAASRIARKQVEIAGAGYP